MEVERKAITGCLNARTVLHFKVQQRLADTVYLRFRQICAAGNVHHPVIESEAMNPAPVVFSLFQEEMALKRMRESLMVAAPIVNENREVVKIYFRDELNGTEAARPLPEEIPLVIMAGGKGTRSPLSSILDLPFQRPAGPRIPGPAAPLSG